MTLTDFTGLLHYLMGCYFLEVLGRGWTGARGVGSFKIYPFFNVVYLLRQDLSVVWRILAVFRILYLLSFILVFPLLYHFPVVHSRSGDLHSLARVSATAP